MTLLLFVASCSKHPETIGNNLQPTDSHIGIYRTDTIQFDAYSVFVDSVRTDESSANLFGSMYDPVFGTTTAGFYTQFRLSTNGQDFGETPQLDSLVLVLVYSGYYGDTTTLQNMHVFELQQDIYQDSGYYSSTNLAVETVDYANYAFYPRPNTQYVLNDDTLVAMIRIPLSNISTELGERLLNATEEQLESTDSFKEFFKGLYVVAEPVSTNGCISYFNLTNASSLMSIYYSNETGDSLRYDFYISSTEARINQYEHNGYQNASSEFQAQVQNNDTALGRQAFYVQSMGGIRTFLRFPYFSRMQEEIGGNNYVVLNDAKLIFTGADQNNDLSAPNKLSLIVSKGDGTYTTLPDYSEGESYYGGTYDSASNSVQFRITEYLQSIISSGVEAENHGLYLSINGASYNAERWVINGLEAEVADTLKSTRLEIIYSIVNQ